MYHRYTTYKQIQQAWAKASPAEKKQITECVSAARCSFNFFLITLNNLDTGRQFLTVGYGLEDTEGISTNLIRKMIGLPPLPEKSNGSQSRDSQAGVHHSKQAPKPTANQRDSGRATDGRGKQVIQGHNQVPGHSTEPKDQASRKPLAKGGKKKSK